MITSLRAATLAVGTEIVDGQVLDRNSTFISTQVTHAGLHVIEHRAVADDRDDIARALTELAARTDLLFVTGGLGPTSDDFTRDVIASAFAQPLEFDQRSWTKIQDRLNGRGIAVREIQKQQCYYPRGSRIFDNPVGTANAFALTTKSPQSRNDVQIFVLPGPPTEIAAIWEASLRAEIEALVPPTEREQLVIFRCLGRPESEVAEKTEAAIGDTDIRVGYRAHLPYVEVKLWIPAAQRSVCEAAVSRVQTALGDWITNRGDEDLAEQFLRRLELEASAEKRPGATAAETIIFDHATFGVLQQRLQKSPSHELKLAILTSYSTAAAQMASSELSAGINENGLVRKVFLIPDAAAACWRLSVQLGTQTPVETEIKPPPHYSFNSERARKFLTEACLRVLVREPGSYGS